MKNKTAILISDLVFKPFLRFAIFSKKKKKKTSILSNTVVTSSYYRDMQNEKKEKVKFVA